MRRSHRNAWNSFNRSRSETNIIPPWCSSGKVSRRKLVPKCEIQSSYPPREDIWEYLYKENRGKKKVCKQRRHRKTKLVTVVVILLAGFTGFLWTVTTTPNIPDGIELMNKLITKVKLAVVSWKPLVSEECCIKMKYLTLELSRAEHYLRNTLRLRHRVTQNYPLPDSNANKYLEGVLVTKGRETEEWGSRAALWGIVPLWKASPPPGTVLSLRNPTPADCWPFSGSSGELIFQLPGNQLISGISIEHIRPDTARSAPKHFTVYGNLANNSLVKMMDSHYQRNGPAKQYFVIGSIPAMTRVILKVLSNQGNLKYTCIYRIHLYGNNLPDELSEE